MRSSPNELRERLGTIGLWVIGAAIGGAGGPAALARETERLGVRALWVGGSNPDPAAIADRVAMVEATERLVVATGVVSIWAWDPTELHKLTAALERDRPGRFILGLGVSHAPLVERLGRHYQHPLATMRAFLDVLDEAAIGSTPPPRVLAALGTKMLTLAKERSAGAHPYLGTPDHTARARDILGPEPVLAPEQAVVVSIDREAGRQIAREYLQRYLTLPNYLSNLKACGFDEPDFAGGGSDRLVDTLVPSGRAADVAVCVRAHLDAGADHVCIQPLTTDQAIDLRGFGEMLEALS